MQRKKKIHTQTTNRDCEIVGKRIILDLKSKGLDKITTFKGTYLEAMKWEYDTQTDRQYIWMRGETQPFDNKYSPNWRIAKAHLATTLTYWVPSQTHNWVHFHFLDIAASITPTIVPRESVLGNFLFTHLRFTSSINTAGPGKSFVEPNAEQTWATHLLIWKVQPVSQQQFVSYVATNTYKHYFGNDKYSVHDYRRSQDCKQALPPAWVKTR